jgi:hypothetical protein
MLGAGHYSVREPHHVHGIDVGPDQPRLLGQDERPLGCVAQPGPAGLQHLGVPAQGLHHGFGQAALGLEVAGHDLHPGEKGPFRLGAVQHLQCFAAQDRDLTAECRGLKVEPGGEVPVQRADAHAGPFRDVLERRVRALLRECLGRGHE